MNEYICGFEIGERLGRFKKVLSKEEFITYNISNLSLPKEFHIWESTYEDYEIVQKYPIIIDNDSKEPIDLIRYLESCLPKKYGNHTVERVFNQSGMPLEDILKSILMDKIDELISFKINNIK